LTTPENRPEPSEMRGHTALRAFFGTELKVSIGPRPEQTGSTLCMLVENCWQRRLRHNPPPCRHTEAGIEAGYAFCLHFWSPATPEHALFFLDTSANPIDAGARFH
jgi:hypothetical protein